MPGTSPINREIEIQPTGGLSSARIEALADGLFAIAMTLLIFDLKAPTITDRSPLALAHAVLAIWPQAACFVMSFITTATLWVAHRGQFHYIVRTDRPLLWINIVFLLLVSIIPFVTSLLGKYPQNAFAIMLYGANMVLAVIVLLYHWRYATQQHRLTARHLNDEIVRVQSRRILMGPCIYLFAMAFAPRFPVVSVAMYALVPIAYALPSSVDTHWHRQSHHA